MEPPPAPSQAPWSAGTLLKILSALPPPTCALMRAHACSQINKIFGGGARKEKKMARWGTDEALK